MVVELRPEDLENKELRMMNEEPAFNSQLNMMYFQEALERLCWQQGNMKQTAPAQRMADFTRKKLSYDLPESSYAPGLVSSPLHFWMPPFIADRLSKPFDFVRVDLYLTPRGVRFGELTFTPAAALDNKRLPETDLRFGRRMEETL